jgi:WD40 repeat protein
LFSTGADKKMHRWETEGAKKVAEVPVGGEAFKMMRGGTWVFVPSADKQLRSITWSDNKVAHAMSGYQDWVLSPAYHAGTSMIAGGANNGEVRLWNATDGKLVRHWIAKP